MQKQVYKIDKKGHIKEIYVAEFIDGNNCSEKLDDDIITISPQNGLYRAKWTGTEWIEGMTQKEIDELNSQPKEPTEKEKQQEMFNTLGQELALLKLQFMMGGMENGILEISF